MSNEFNKAIEDLNWLSNRLSGVIALKDVLTSQRDLINSRLEIENLITENTKVLETLRKEKESIKEEIAEFKAKSKQELETAKKKAEELLVKASEEASLKLLQAEDQSKNLLSTAENNVKKCHSEELNLKERINDLKNSVHVEEKKLTEITQEISRLRNRL